MDITGFYRVVPSFIEILLGFHGYHWTKIETTGFYLVLPYFINTELQQMFTEIHRDLPVLPGFT